MLTSIVYVAILLQVNLITRKLNFCDSNSSNLLQLTQLIDLATLLQLSTLAEAPRSRILR